MLPSSIINFHSNIFYELTPPNLQELDVAIGYSLHSKSLSMSDINQVKHGRYVHMSALQMRIRVTIHLVSLLNDTFNNALMNLPIY